MDNDPSSRGHDRADEHDRSRAVIAYRAEERVVNNHLERLTRTRPGQSQHNRDCRGGPRSLRADRHVCLALDLADAQT